MSCFARCSVAAPMRNYVPGPKRSRGTTRSPANSITRCIDAVWLVSVMAFFIVWGVGSFFSLYLFIFSQRYSRGLSFYVLCCGLSIYVFALDVPDSIGPRGSGFQTVRVDFLFVRFLGVHRESACVSHLPMARPSHPWRSMQPLWAHDGWFTFRWYYFR